MSEFEVRFDNRVVPRPLDSPLWCASEQTLTCSLKQADLKVGSYTVVESALDAGALEGGPERLDEGRSGLRHRNAVVVTTWEEQTRRHGYRLASIRANHSVGER